MNINFSNFRFQAICLLLLWLFTASNLLVAQEDPIESAKIYPPRLLSKDQNETSLSVIKWQKARLKLLQEPYVQASKRIDEKIKRERAEIAELVEQLPVSHRSLDAATRSDLAGKVLDQNISAQLDLKAIDQSLGSLEKLLKEEQNSKSLVAARQAGELEVKAAQLKQKFAKAEAQRVEKLHSKGTMSMSQKKNAEYTAAIADLELTKAKLNYANITSDQVSEIASQIVQHRVEAESVKSRIKAATSLLESFAKTQLISERIVEGKEQIAVWRKDRQVMLRELAKVESELAEAEVLEFMISKELNKLKADQEKGSNNKD